MSLVVLVEDMSLERRCLTPLYQIRRSGRKLHTASEEELGARLLLPSDPEECTGWISLEGHHHLAIISCGIFLVGMQLAQCSNAQCLQEFAEYYFSPSRRRSQRWLLQRGTMSARRHIHAAFGGSP